MNVARFFENWRIAEDPFRAEEARQDAVFLRLDAPIGHPDFEKIVGDLQRPSTSIVFGEKGAGKTAIRLQIERRVSQHNDAHPDSNVLLTPYDDLNPILDRLHDRIGKDDPLVTFRKIRLVDHMDGVLCRAVTTIADGLLAEPVVPPPPDFLAQPAKVLRRLPRALKLDLLILVAVYDASDRAPERLRRLRRMLRLPIDRRNLAWLAAVWLVWLLPAAVVGVWWSAGRPTNAPEWLYAFLAALGLCVALVVKRTIFDALAVRHLAGRLAAQARVLPRAADSLAESLALLPMDARRKSILPITDTDSQRYGMFERLRRVLRAFKCHGMVVVIDRVDEPTLVSGDPERMRAVVWPILNNKFLQMDGFAIKLLLPIELRHAIFRESSMFFQEARLDKQNLVERLAWTGPTLYDLCNARLAACLAPGAEPITLRDLFEPEVTREDLINSLEQMRRPRDAFKLIYRCVQEHCAAVTDDDPRWKIPRHVLENVRKREAERVEQINRGLRPG